jgi:hypothetical protein
MGDVGFRREMLLQVVPEEGQDVLAEDIHYYDDPPFDDGNYMAHGGDLAISTKESADCTSLVSGEVSWSSGALEIYVQPNPLNRRMTFHETMDAFDQVRHRTHHRFCGSMTRISCCARTRASASTLTVRKWSMARIR